MNTNKNIIVSVILIDTVNGNLVKYNIVLYYWYIDMYSRYDNLTDKYNYII